MKTERYVMIEIHAFGEGIFNPTPYPAKPKIRFYFGGTADGGTITINGVSISAQDPNTADTFIIECDRQDIYKYENKESWNNEFSLLDGEFFELKPGRNVVTCSGVQQGRIHITPNWWTV